MTEEQTHRLDVGERTVLLRPATEAEASTQVVRVPQREESAQAAGEGDAAERTQVVEPPSQPPEHTVVLPRISTDPLDELVDRIRPRLARAVDALQVAAALEADGFTDRIARVEYGFPDVFALAAEVFDRLGPSTDTIVEPLAAGHHRRDTLRLIAHGPLYALPAAVFPALLGMLGQRSVVLALVVASGLGWMVAGTVAYGAYRLLGAYRPGAAARVLCVAALLAPPLGAGAGYAVLGMAGGDGGLVVLAAGQLAYQMAATVLMFYRREAIQAALMTPAVLAGGAYLMAGAAWRPVALTAAVAGVTACYLAALWTTRGHRAGVEPSARPPLPGLFGVTCYGLCSAALLLHAEGPYLLGRLDVAVAVAPLIAAMGVVEWRAERFRGAAVRLTRHSHNPHDFGRRMWRLVARETVACLAAPALLGLVLLAVLDGIGRLSATVALMTAAHVALGGAYYSAFVLAGFERFGRLCAAILVALAVHLGIGGWLGAAPLLGQTDAPRTDAALYLGSTLGLLGLFLISLAPILGQVRHYR
ncbi:hypothetical protein [Mangrovihabitans endophyticus]|uniref:Uncharacterized protein n=1 Tax=Mangrovihabitans endophyticus TaxID=1751298 RepID=A0A8J3BWW8_9ACTN|nr:hypothetical protein [Mangrovihabitans endophyticus]GGK78187.1 hypothetical protein GCM10012284_10120 [Mangrovihabitans endophyticus]